MLTLDGSLYGLDITAVVEFDPDTDEITGVTGPGADDLDVALDAADPGLYSAMPAGPSMTLDRTKASPVLCWFLSEADDPTASGEYPPAYVEALGPDEPDLVN